VQAINGVSDHGNIAEVFRCNFESAAKPIYDRMNDKLQQEFCTAFNSYCGTQFNVDEVMNVEVVDSMICSLNRARAVSPDGITAEHLLYSHPSLFLRHCVNCSQFKNCNLRASLR
jgi:hypothetical protein